LQKHRTIWIRLGPSTEDDAKSYCICSVYYFSSCCCSPFSVPKFIAFLGSEHAQKLVPKEMHKCMYFWGLVNFWRKVTPQHHLPSNYSTWIFMKLDIAATFSIHSTHHTQHLYRLTRQYFVAPIAAPTGYKKSQISLLDLLRCHYSLDLLPMCAEDTTSK